MVCGLWTISYADIPKVISYQGKLLDSQNRPITGTVNITFKIYDAESGGAPLWIENYANLVIDKGIFNVMLGGVTALNLPFDKQYYLGIQVGSDPEMMPRQRLASAGYAYRAETAPIPFYIKGFELVYSSATSVSVNPGIMFHGAARIDKIASTALALANPADWYDGTVHSYAGGAGWCYIGVNSSGNIRFLANNPPNKADTYGNTEGTKRYWYDGAEY